MKARNPAAASLCEARRLRVWKASVTRLTETQLQVGRDRRARP